MAEIKKFICEFCEMNFSHAPGLSRHKKNRCLKKQEMQKKELQKKEKEIKKNACIEEQLKQSKIQVKELKAQLQDHKNQIQNLLNQLEKKDILLINNLEKHIEFNHETQQKSMDALAFLVTHRKQAPPLKRLTKETTKELMTCDEKLLKHVLYQNGEGTLSDYISDIILNYIKKDDPDQQSVWNSDVSRLTYLIRDLVGDEQEWLRDPQGAKFTKYVIDPIITHLKTFLDESLYSNILDSSESSNSGSETDKDDKSVLKDSKMVRIARIHDAIHTLKSKKFKKDALEYIGSRVPLHKSNGEIIKNKKCDDKPKNTIKKSIDYSSDDNDEKPKKVMKKAVKKIVDYSSDSADEKPKKVIKKTK